MTFGMIPCKCGNNPELEMHITCGITKTTIQCPKCKRGVTCCDHFNGTSILRAVKVWNQSNVEDISTSVASMEVSDED